MNWSWPTPRPERPDHAGDREDHLGLVEHRAARLHRRSRRRRRVPSWAAAWCAGRLRASVRTRRPERLLHPRANAFEVDPERGQCVRVDLPRRRAGETGRLGATARPSARRLGVDAPADPRVTEIGRHLAQSSRIVFWSRLTEMRAMPTRGVQVGCATKKRPLRRVARVEAKTALGFQATLGVSQVELETVDF